MHLLFAVCKAPTTIFSSAAVFVFSSRALLSLRRRMVLRRRFCLFYGSNSFVSLQSILRNLLRSLTIPFVLADRYHATTLELQAVKVCFAFH